MNQDMYNEEGFKVITYSEMGEEIETTLKKIDKKMDITFENEQNKQIYNILYTLFCMNKHDKLLYYLLPQSIKKV